MHENRRSRNCFVSSKRGSEFLQRPPPPTCSRLRRFDTRLSTIYLLVPRFRTGGHVPFFVTERRRSRAALLEVVQEAYINGVFRRKIEHLAKTLGVEALSGNQVSEINKGLDDEVKRFRGRRLATEYPIL